MRRLLALAGFALCLTLAWVVPSAAQSGGEADSSQPTVLEGTLRLGFDQFFSGVEVTVVDQSGTWIGQAVTDADGQWSVVVPGAGTYRVTLDESTLPDGIGLREGFESTVEAAVTEGASRAVVFAVGDAPKGTPFGERAAQTVFNGLKFGLIIAMSAIGLSLIYGTTGLVNFAHGELVTFGAVIAWYFNSSWGGLNLIAAAIVTMIVCGMLGAGLETGLFRPLRRRRLGIFQLVVVTIGLSLLGRQVIQLFFGAEPLPYTDFQVQERWEFGPWAVTPRELVTVAVIVAILLAVGIMLQWTRFGKATRAVSDNSSLAEASGINVNRVVLMVWAMGAALAGLGGVFQGLDTDIDPFLGFQLLLLIFAGVELGGLGTAFGALAGSLIIGMSTEVSTLWISPELKFVVPLAALILVLLIRPQGLFGIKARVG
ncbi:MAG: branched-chain amino acid ABC transporter permease [Acidimicrobiia bacterium]|nr:branched-chain amino acid ABC transporter permease [Acidimicrobiia bacterium]MXZ86488.1 branched-chain amino acid ABC transporter permease [Acidimicrobiia bacterium]MYB10084.1 branched-chain amino acid ABC transporter permease [Acidimicrobiia bacterium]MYB75106.1 branched-chain amino acid ABC transporter permease [Acidimicrobiia bacterium]MYG59934.1 branched-chain amino acid ABC transporter permease [Acidimicrobiia bacterium]